MNRHERGIMMTQEEAEEQFSQALEGQGYGSHHVTANDDKWHGLELPGSDDDEKTGGAKLHHGDDGIRGVVIDYRRKDKVPIFKWRPANGAASTLTDEERKAAADQSKKQAAEKKAEQERVRLESLGIYSSAAEATIDHPYLAKKKITHVGNLKVDKDGNLVVPIYDAMTDEFQAIQLIDPNGMKRYLKNGVKVSSYAIWGNRRTIGAAAKNPRHEGRIVITEGVATAAKIADSTTGTWVLAAMDCDNLLPVAAAMRERFPLREVIIAADFDVKPDGRNPGLAGATRAAIETDSKIAVPPPGDFWDLWNAEGAAAVARIIDGADYPVTLPKIVVDAGVKVTKLADDAEQVLLKSGFSIYERGGSLVHPVIREVEAARAAKTNVVQLQRIEQVYLRDVLSRVSDWVKYNDRAKKVVPLAQPPQEVVQTILGRNHQEWPFLSLKAVISTPTLRPDGTILDQPGYDQATGFLLIDPPEMPPIPDQPTHDDAVAALALLEGLLDEFPFVGESSKTVALSCLITPVVRAAFPVAPLHVISATAPGSGKGHLLNTAAAIVIGDRMPIISMGPNADELEKRLGPRLITGQSLISIDNVNGELRGDALGQFIEHQGPQVVRILGKSEDVSLDLGGTTFFANGNNITVAGDLTRRTIRANLDARQENPELRIFKADPVKKVLADRGPYVAAALTICRAYIVAGRPTPAPPFGSFEGWSDTVRSALMWLGKPDPLTREIKDENPDRIELSDMIEAWASIIGIGPKRQATLAEVLALALEVDRDANGILTMRWPDLAGAVNAIAKGKKPDTNLLGIWARSFKGRVVGNRRLINKAGERTATKWWVEDITDPDADAVGKKDVM
jgi:putative DNA primase/helicase